MSITFCNKYENHVLTRVLTRYELYLWTNNDYANDGGNGDDDDHDNDDDHEDNDAT